MISLINHDFQWGRSEVVIIYPEVWEITISKFGNESRTSSNGSWGHGATIISKVYLVPESFLEHK